MKEKIHQFIKVYWLDVCLSFVLPVGLLAISYATLGIYWGSERSILASDAFPQYATFHASFNNVLHGVSNIFYSWSGSLGLNYIALMGYYLNGFFTWIVVFFDNVDMPNALYLLTLLKIGGSGVAFWVFAHSTYQLKRGLILGLTVCYALMSFTVAYSVVIMWLDTFVYLPLIVLGIHQLMDKRNPLLLFISYTLLFLSSFYMAFMAGLFSFLYFVCRLLTNRARYTRSILQYSLIAITSGGVSMITVLPTILDLRTNGETLTAITSFWNTTVGAWDLVAKNLVSMYDTSKYNSMPFVYVGIVPLLFALYYFVSKRIPFKNKVSYGVLLLFLCLSIYIEPLNLMWQGLHAPYMFLYRFSFTIPFLLLILAGASLEKFTKEDINRFTNLCLVVGGVYLAFFFLSNKRRYGEISTQSLVLTFALLASYLALFLFWLSSDKRPRFQKHVPLVVLGVICGEMLFNSIGMVNGIMNEWYYPLTETYQTGHKDIQTLVDTANEAEEGFFRLENQDPISINDSFNFGYSGVTMFSSIRNRKSSSFLNALGFRSTGTNLTINYKNNTLMADGLIGMRYNIAKEDPKKFGYEKVAESGEYQLYENRYALPLGMITDDGILKSGVINQTDILNYLAGTKGELVTLRDLDIIESQNVELVDNQDGTLTLGTKELNQAKILKWSVTLPANTQGYLSLVPTEFLNLDVSLTVEGETQEASLTNDGQYYNLGTYTEPVTLEVSAQFTSEGIQNFSIYRPDLLLIDTTKYAEVLTKAQEHALEMVVNGNRVSADVTLSNDQLVLTTIPYDEGWSVSIDGKKTDIQAFKDAFIAFDVSKGTHKIDMVYIPQGFKIGGIVSILSFLTFLVYFLWWKRRSSNASS